MKAAEYGHDKTVELLAKSGADMSIRDEEGKGEDLLHSENRQCASACIISSIIHVDP